MGKKLEIAITKIRELPEADQDWWGEHLLRELDDIAWKKKFNETADKLGSLADEALAEHRADLTKPLHV